MEFNTKMYRDTFIDSLMLECTNSRCLCTLNIQGKEGMKEMGMGMIGDEN